MIRRNILPLARPHIWRRTACVIPSNFGNVANVAAGIHRLIDVPARMRLPSNDRRSFLGIHSRGQLGSWGGLEIRQENDQIIIAFLHMGS